MTIQLIKRQATIERLMMLALANGDEQGYREYQQQHREVVAAQVDKAMAEF